MLVNIKLGWKWPVAYNIWRYDILHDSIQHSDCQHNKTQHNKAQHNVVLSVAFFIANLNVMINTVVLIVVILNVVAPC